ncbi:MAG TPA: FAD-dependent oxidoreductase [Candidatus Paceibacterota bacterium]|nr:FAD-dependent oxidoreductase [Candidatus Paceibacterota bacterium]
MTLQRQRRIPNILLIGAGRFGEIHLQKLLALQKEGLLSLLGVVVASSATRDRIQKTYGVQVWTELSDAVLAHTDAVDIVTPPETHAELALRCLQYADVLIEKPLATNLADARAMEACAKKYKRVLMVGYIFRFDPMLIKLKKLLSPFPRGNVHIRGEFINPRTHDDGRDPVLEMSHPLDSIRFVSRLGAPTLVTHVPHARTSTLEIQYAPTIHATVNMGWEGEAKRRTLTYTFDTKEIHADFMGRTIEIKDRFKNITKNIRIPHTANDPLTEEIVRFLDVIRGKKVSYPTAADGVGILELKEQAVPTSSNKKRPRVAIIGAGIFGTNCAIELAKFCDVVLIERNEDILQEASFVNQYRHHWGYHYPRSSETVRDIAVALPTFETRYEKAIIRNFPTYYAIAKSGSRVTPREYLDFCRAHGLAFTKEFPDPEFLNRNKVSLSLKTLEPIYNYDILVDITKKLLGRNSIEIRLSTAVQGGRIKKNGAKELSLKSRKGVYKEPFDYVINATYAQYNQLAHWFNFPIKPIRIDLVEALIVQLPLPRISLAVMDGPFTNLVPTSTDGLFTLVHIRESILERYVPRTGLPNVSRKIRKRNVAQTLKKSRAWFPILSHATIQEVRYTLRAVNAGRERDDGRPSDVSYHGFGIWSVLGGKIINSVIAAQEIANQIRKD